MLSVNTRRFGRIGIENERVICFSDGVLGFPEQKRYALLEHKPGSPFFWLQSLDTPDLAFVLINPFLIKKDYLASLSSSEKRLFESPDEGEKLVFALVTIPHGQAEKMTANLMGPLVIDVQTRVGRQVILAHSGYSHRHPIVSS
jgi:flagellar assembly factor FliW